MPFVSSGTPNIKNLEDKIDKLHESVNRKWWEKTWIQLIGLIGAIVGIIGFLLLLK